MNTMQRLFLFLPFAVGGLLTSCVDPYGPPPGYGPRQQPYGPVAPLPPANPRGDGYTGDPYAPDNGYGQGDGGYGQNNNGGYGQGDGGGYTPNPTPPPRNTPPPASGPKQHPVAERTKNPNQVLSPYEPYNVIDVTGFKSGQLAKDPSNGKIFRVP